MRIFPARSFSLNHVDNVFLLFLDERKRSFLASPTGYGCLMLLPSELKSPGSRPFFSKLKKKNAEQILEASQSFLFANLF